MPVQCTCTQGRNCTAFVYVACRMHVAKVELSSTSATGALRQLATGSFLSQLSQIAFKADSQYNFLRRDTRFSESCIVNRPLRPIHNTTFCDATCDVSCVDSDTRFTIFFMFATSSYDHAQVVLCPCSARAPRVETVCVCRVWHVAKVELSSTSATGALRQLATARDWQFRVATVANRVSRRRKLYCESGFEASGLWGMPYSKLK